MKAEDYALQKDENGDWILRNIKTERVYERHPDRYRPGYPWHRLQKSPQHPVLTRTVVRVQVSESDQKELESIFQQKMKESKE
jgi:hypothetical protein